MSQNSTHGTETESSRGDQIYFVDPERGSDENDGRRRTAAWATFEPLNKRDLAPGDRVEVYPGTFEGTLAITGSGTASNPVTVQFTPGVYEFTGEHALDRTLQISNTNGFPEEPKRLGILFDDAEHVEVLGRQAEIQFHRKVVELCVDGADHVTVDGLSFDYQRPTVSEFQVESVDDEAAVIDVHADSTYEIDGGDFVWQGPGWSYSNTDYAQELNLETNVVSRTDNPLLGMDLAEIESHRIRATGEHDMTPGRVFQLRDTGRDYAGVFIRRSSDVTFTNVDFYYLHGMGIVAQFSEDLHFQSMSIAPLERSGRTTGTWADGVQVSGCRGDVRFEDCHFCGSHDDHINVHGTYLSVAERRSDTELLAEFSHHQTFGFLALNPGDDVVFMDPDTLEEFGDNTVEDAELVSPTEIAVTLEQPAPERLSDGHVIDNCTWYPDLEIRNCHSSRSAVRGFLVTNRKQSVVRDNVFQPQTDGLPAIHVGEDAKFWYESGSIRDLRIEDNTFVHACDPAVSLDHTDTDAEVSIHENVRIENNVFIVDQEDPTLVVGDGVTGVTIDDNRVKYRGEKPSPDDLYELTNCEDVRIGDTEFIEL